MIQNRKNDAFTLMEVMIAVTVIGVLAALAGPGIMRMREKLKVNSTMATIAALETAINDYREDMGGYPNKREGGLEAIVERPSGKAGAKWKGPYLKGRDTLPLDAWKNEFELHLGAQIVKDKKHKYYEIMSPGPSRDEDNEEDNIYKGE